MTSLVLCEVGLTRVPARLISWADTLAERDGWSSFTGPHGLVRSDSTTVSEWDCGFAREDDRVTRDFVHGPAGQQVTG